MSGHEKILRTLLCLVSTVILSTYLLSCLDDDDIKLLSITPKHGTKDVARNSVITMTFESSAPLSQHSLTGEYFSLYEITGKKSKISQNENTQDDNDDESEESNSREESTDTSLSGIVIAEAPVGISAQNIPVKSGYRTVVHYIPKCSKEAKAPLPKNRKLRFEIGKLETTGTGDEIKTFPGKEIEFETAEGGFQFSRNPKIVEYITPKIDPGSKGVEIAPNQIFFVRFDGPVHPLLLSKYSTVIARASAGVDWRPKLPDEAQNLRDSYEKDSEELAEITQKLEKLESELKSQADQIIARSESPTESEPPTESEFLALELKEKEYERLTKKQEILVAKLKQSGLTDEEIAGVALSPTPKDNATEEPIYISYFEKLKVFQTDYNIPITLEYNLVGITSHCRENDLCELTLKATPEHSPKVIERIDLWVDSTKSPFDIASYPELKQLTEIDFFANGSGESS